MSDETDDMTDEVRSSDGTRLNHSLSNELAETVTDLAKSTGSTKTAVVRQAIALMKLAHDQKRKGRHLGFTSSSEQLETEVVGNF